MWNIIDNGLQIFAAVSIIGALILYGTREHWKDYLKMIAFIILAGIIIVQSLRIVGSFIPECNTLSCVVDRAVSEVQRDNDM